MDRGAWWATVHGITHMFHKVHTHMSDYVYTYGLPWKLSGKGSVCDAGDVGSTSGSERSPGEGNGNPLQYSCLGNPMDR